MQFRRVGTKKERHPKSFRPEFVERPFFLNCKGRTVLRQAQGERDWRDSSYFARVALGGHQTRIASHRKPHAMKFFADTAEIADIQELAATGLLDGVTTNPSLIATSVRDFKEVTKDICALVAGPVSAGVVALASATKMNTAEEG